MIQEIKVAVDAVVFNHNSLDGMSVLLIRRKYEPFQGCWALPGGLVKNEESLEEAVLRELKEETNLKLKSLEQLHSFGRPDRDPRNRVVSVAFYGLIKPGEYQLRARTDAEDVAWFNINDLPALAFDHAEILNMAITRLKEKDGIHA